MCIICASPAGAPQPDTNTIAKMFAHNPHGAGYMYARDGKVTIHKGFMYLGELLAMLRREHFTEHDSVVYHFRISTQAGVKPAMTQPFPLAQSLRFMEALDLHCGVGVAHNGIIRLTSDPRETRYSDTALFISRYLTRLIDTPDDLHDRNTLDTIWSLARSKLAILDSDGNISTVGDFIKDGGLLYSNFSYR